MDMHEFRLVCIHIHMIKGYPELLKLKANFPKLTLKVGTSTFKVGSSQAKLEFNFQKLTLKVGIQLLKVGPVNFQSWIPTSKVNFES